MNDLQIKRRITNNSFNVSRETRQAIRRYFMSNKNKYNMLDCNTTLALYDDCLDYAVYKEGGFFDGTNIKRKYGYFYISCSQIAKNLGINKRKAIALMNILESLNAITLVEKGKISGGKAIASIYFVNDLVNAEVITTEKVKEAENNIKNKFTKNKKKLKL